jgi:hypothetical protein
MGTGDNPLDEPDVPGVNLASTDLRNRGEGAFITKSSMLRNLLLTDGINDGQSDWSIPQPVTAA